MIGEPYIRKKGKGFVIERKVNGKTIYLSSLPKARVLHALLKNPDAQAIIKQEKGKVKWASRTTEEIEKELDPEASENAKRQLQTILDKDLAY